MLNEQDSIKVLKGVGDKSASLFFKCKVHTVGDLKEYYPRHYERFPVPITFGEMKEGERCAVIARVHSRMTIKRIRQRKVCVLRLKSEDQIREIAWFNAPFLANVFHVNEAFVFVGEAVKKNGVLTFQHPGYYTLPQYEALKDTFQPVYRLTEGLTNNMVRKCVTQLQPLFSEQAEYLSSSFLKEHDLICLSAAYHQIHFPTTEASIIAARKRLVFHEFLQFFIYLEQMKEEQETRKNSFQIRECSEVAELIAMLPYQLTNAQLTTFEEIKQDLMCEASMNRLVQGDVGSGKTIIAILALLMVAKSGYQGALMVPTEVLATQHYETMNELLSPFGVTVGLLTGSQTAAEKKSIYRQVEQGEISILVGTHALIQEKLSYANLALVVTDEQHRFGVKQRERFFEKGDNPHVLVMSATPIPRTLAMMLYADMSISFMRELPKNRLPIKNCVVGTSYRAAATQFMQQEINKGHQCYVICPMVEENEKVELENVTDYAKQLQEVLPHARIAFLHGKMNEVDKNTIMSTFAEGGYDILVSTTVIEVGINVPNATFMLIENAERFGLATLHQLRGRVGRGADQSYCVFMYGKETEKNKERLEVLHHSNDGFYIANEDLKLRGPGDFFGIRQSGALDFKLADLYQDAALLTLAHDYYEQWKKDGMDLSDYPCLHTFSETSTTI